eukprot:TRINITY_DN14064_c0_g1_i1.p1 TRINITY_DN14064_c0_g1~~TRINITY_DN14064_c0_g1_i1.p1  ORF type:complete len:189 (-),score=39.73 TRINITY_DN14064_c0_g1_i1:107-673(-)
MSSIQEAIEKDFRKGRAARTFNPVVMSHKQEAEAGNVHDEFHQRIQEQRAEVRAQRMAEGGRGGGYNERAGQVVATAASSGRDATGGYDDFGRRVSGAASDGDVRMSKVDHEEGLGAYAASLPGREPRWRDCTSALVHARARMRTIGPHGRARARRVAAAVLLARPRQRPGDANVYDGLALSLEATPL